MDAVVIGAGMSGLGAGIRLAQAGREVTILERHSLWGGLNSFYKLGGRRFDVGLHALTNFVPARTRGRPLTRVLRQLRIAHADLRLGEQSYSRVLFPSGELRFSNDIELLRSEVARLFPRCAGGFERMLAELPDYPEPGQAESKLGAREALAQYLSEPLLIEMLLLPICYYGSPTANDLPWSSFAVLFRSLFEEGFARPEGGVRHLLDLLRKRFLDEGGQLRMRCGVARIHSREGRVQGVELDDGERIDTSCVLSSAGWVETMQLAGEEVARKHLQPTDAGRLSFHESISILDRPTRELGHEATITFFNTEERLVYDRPPEPIDYRSGVICCPDNYRPPGATEEGTFRVTLLANHDRWVELAEDPYRALKSEVYAESHARLAELGPDVREHVVFHDAFTPRTIVKFTGHVGGAVYGSPRKHATGETPLDGLYLTGTDQGLLGIVGALHSGISVANARLRPGSLSPTHS